MAETGNIWLALTRTYRQEFFVSNYSSFKRYMVDHYGIALDNSQQHTGTSLVNYQIVDEQKFAFWLLKYAD